MKKLIIQMLFLGVIISSVKAQDVRTQLRQIAGDLSTQIAAKGKNRVAISSFLDLKNQETQLGRYMADKFSIGMIASSLQITDRSQLATQMEENKLSAKSILDPKTAATLGKLTGAQVVITGNYTVLDNTLDITVKAIDLERGLVLAIAEGSVPRTSEMNKLLDDTITPDPKKPLDPDVKKTSTTARADPNFKAPAQKSDCEAAPSCVICVTNEASQPIITALSNFRPYSEYTKLHIMPGTTKCWKAVPFYPNEDYHKINLEYWTEAETRISTESFVILRCQTYFKTFNQ